LKFKSLAEKKKEGHKLPMRIILAGQEGSGKTSCLASLCNNGYKVYCLDFDYENESGLINRLSEEGESNYIGIPMYAEYNEKNKQSKGKSSYECCIQTLEELKDSGILDDPETVLVIDSLTNYATSVALFSEKLTGSGEKDLRRTIMDSWQLAVFFLAKIFTYTKNCKLVILAHLREVEIEGKPTRIALNFLSKNYSLEISKFAGMQAIYMIEKTPQKPSGCSVKIITEMSNKYQFIKNPYSDIPVECEPDNFLINLINRHETGKWQEL